MRVTILVPDNQVTVNNSVSLVVDCSELAADNVHAVQWHDTYGEVEYTTEFLSREKRWHRELPNEHITDFSPYQLYVDRWVAAKEKYDAEQKQAQDEMVTRGRMAQKADADARASYERFLNDNPELKKALDGLNGNS